MIPLHWIVKFEIKPNQIFQNMRAEGNEKTNLGKYDGYFMHLFLRWRAATFVNIKSLMFYFEIMKDN